MKLRRFAREWRLAWRITKLNFRARLEYRAEFLMTIVLGVIWQSSVLVFATVLLTQFSGMGGWSSREVLLMASMRLLSHGLYLIFFGRVAWITVSVQRGYLDAFLLRPMPVHRQVQLAVLNVNAVGDLCMGLVLFVAAAVAVDLNWTPVRIVYLLIALGGGALMEGAIKTGLSCVTMHMPTAMYWGRWLDEIMTAFGNYPLHILPWLARDLLTYVLPLGFIAYLPAAVLTGRTDTLAVPALLAVASPLVGLIGYLASRQAWAISLRHYQGFGGT
jgi:ABC-2 type transport system permease protein